MMFLCGFMLGLLQVDYPFMHVVVAFGTDSITASSSYH